MIRSLKIITLSAALAATALIPAACAQSSDTGETLAKKVEKVAVPEATVTSGQYKNDPGHTSMSVSLIHLGFAPYAVQLSDICLLYTSPSPRDRTRSRMPSSA